MQIKDMFRKKIDREIQGVIIVGQGEETNVAQELEEYVVTRELQRHFADFFAAYKKGIQGTTPKMGVWISGFFGSGKSHFLKILSYLLQNKQVGDKHAIDYFIEDQKITNQMVLADMQLAANTPSDVILFNIDSKSDSNGKENKDAIVNVFLKVFNEMQGFCGSMPHLADLERRLSEEGRFEEFKEKFEEEYGDPWESSRQDFDFIQDSVVDVLSDMDFMSESAARNWCEKATEGYQISIEDFAKRVKSYIDKKGNNHHVVFLVDEIGQYIGDDSKLKMNDRPGTISDEELERAYRNEGVVVDEMFFPDADNVIPITDEEYLDDDIVSRLCAWLKAVYGDDTLEANLDYIAKALGNKGSTSREIIRNYFLNDFFKDHCQTYSVTGSGKRPIYWLFDSGKQNGFKALVYLHRYTPDTIGNLRIDYLHKMQRVYESEINRMQDMMDHSENAREVAAASKRKDKLAKQLKECREYDEKISHLALSRIELDLDDGVKVNYRKLQTAQDGKFYEVLADSKNIMVKEKK